MRERGGRGRIRVVVRWHVDRLNRGDRPLLCRGYPLFESPHLRGKIRLVSHRGRHPAQQGRDFRAGLSEAEDVVNEQQGVLAFDIAEVLGHREAGEPNPETGARRLGHLTVDQGSL